MDLNLILNMVLLCLPIVGYFCWHNIHDYNDLADCVAIIAANKGTIFITNQQAVTDNLTVLATIGLKIIQGGSFNVSAGKTLTINGPIDAGAYLIFEGAGDVVLGPHAIASPFPEWWTD